MEAEKITDEFLKQMGCSREQYNLMVQKKKMVEEFDDFIIGWCKKYDLPKEFRKSFGMLLIQLTSEGKDLSYLKEFGYTQQIV